MQRTITCLLAIGMSVTLAAGSERKSLSEEALAAIEGGSKAASIARLRAEGPAALDMLLELRHQLVMAEATEKNSTRLSLLANQKSRLDEVIDQVGMQRYCSRSRLYWYTDLDQATQAALSSGKPILSLRMLGNLNEDFSCANSRFFRTTLYANQAVSQFLRDNFILHWKSVRPVPKVTIDFGDGRKLERTLTGNSIHYLLTPDGDVVDALPGLYGPSAFLAQLKAGASLARQVAKQASAARRQSLLAYHSERFAKVGRDWRDDLLRVGSAVAMPDLRPVAGKEPAVQPAADSAMAIARPKALVEAPLVRSALPLAADPMKLDDHNVWEAIAGLHASDARLDAGSRDLIRSQNPTAGQAGQVAVTKLRVEDPVERMVRSLESSIAVDTVKNEYRLHREIHRWLSDPTAYAEIETLNERVYAELFLTPSSDPWLGLAPPEVYTALPGAGVAKK